MLGLASALTLALAFALNPNFPSPWPCRLAARGLSFGLVPCGCGLINIAVQSLVVVGLWYANYPWICALHYCTRIR